MAQLVGTVLGDGEDALQLAKLLEATKVDAVIRQTYSNNGARMARTFASLPARLRRVTQDRGGTKRGSKALPRDGVPL
jgi:hypothetical protein